MKSLYCSSLDTIVDLIPKCGYSTFGGFILVLDDPSASDFVFEGKRNIVSRDHASKYSKIENKKLNDGRLLINKKPRITIVRNPYARILSGFSNKKHKVSGMKNNENRSYEEFNLLLDKIKIHNNNNHFICQTDQLFKLQEYKKIFCLESYIDFYDFVGTYNFNERQSELVKKYSSQNIIHNVTNSVEKYSDYLNEKTCAKILNIYHKDFEILGYSKDKKDISLPPQCKK